MPFVLAWIVGWVVVGAAVMALVYALDPINSRPDSQDAGEQP
jgi:hypothetical protein